MDLGNEYKGHFWFFLKDKWIFTHLWEKTTGQLEDKSHGARKRKASSSSPAEVYSWVKWFPPPARHRSASVHPASCTHHQPPAQLQHQQRMASAKTEMILPTLHISEPLSFPHSPMDNYPKLEEVMMLSTAGTPLFATSATEGAGFGSGDPGDQYDHLAGGKIWRFAYFASGFL